MSCHLSWAMGVNARLLSHKNGPVGLLMVVERVKVRMAGSVDDLMLTLSEVLRQKAYVRVEILFVMLVPRRGEIC